MKTILIRIALLNLLLTSNLFAQEQNGWEKVKDENNITIFLRQRDDSKVKEIHAKSEIEGDLALVKMVLTDFANYPKWAYNYEQTQMLEKKNENEYIYYTVITTPWPAEDRDVVLQMHIDDREEGKLTFRTSALPNFKEQKKGIVRMPKFEAVWNYTSENNGTIKVESFIHTEPGGSLPAWLINSMLTDAPFYSISELRKIVKKLSD